MIPSTPGGRKRLLKAFAESPDHERKELFTALNRLNCLMVLWGLDELRTDQTINVDVKKHALLSYKVLGMLWFDQLPKREDQTFSVYLRDRLPGDQGPGEINKIFGTDLDELAVRCKDILRPEWLQKRIKPTKVSLESFPHRAS